MVLGLRLAAAAAAASFASRDHRGRPCTWVCHPWLVDALVLFVHVVSELMLLKEYSRVCHEDYLCEDKQRRWCPLQVVAVAVVLASGPVIRGLLTYAFVVHTYDVVPDVVLGVLACALCPLREPRRPCHPLLLTPSASR